MIGFIRSFLESALGKAIALSIVVLMGLAFASSDVAGNLLGGGVSAERVAKVGKSSITAADLKLAVTNAFEQQRQQNPTLTMKQFLAGDTLDTLLDDMIAREAVMQFGKAHGMIVSDRLVDSELVKIDAFLGPDGKFSEKQYRSLIAQRGLTDAVVRADLANGLMARQLLVPASYGAIMPQTAVGQYVSLLKERRVGTVALIPSAAFAPKEAPSDAVLQGFYKQNQKRYMQPERRTIRYVVFDEAALKNVPAPTEAEIQNAYKANAAQFSASETRTVTQVIVPTEAAAKALAGEVAGGKALEAAATAKGLAPTKLDKLTKAALAGQASQALADAVFATAQGKLAAPGRSPLGWHVIRVDGIEKNTGKTLDQARPELVTQLTEAKRKAALSDTSAKIEEQIDKGASLADVAKQLGLTIATTVPVTQSGQIFGKPQEKAPDAVLPVVNAAFGMENEGEPQLAEVVAGKTFTVYEVGQITQAAPAPLGEIREVVARDYALQQGSAQAKAAADKVLAQLAKGVPLNTALASVGVALPPVQNVNMTREEISQSRERVPPPLALLFAMAKKSSKQLEGPNKLGFYIVSVADIIPGQVDRNDPMLAQAASQLGQITGQEYARQFRAAIRAEVGAEKNATGIGKVRGELVGSGQ
jgi:peptidyl-prolyl cis-trans isomerase D